MSYFFLFRVNYELAQLRYSFGVALLSRADTLQVQPVQPESNAYDQTSNHLPLSASESQDLIDLSSTSTIDNPSSDVPQTLPQSRLASLIQPTSEPMFSRQPDVIMPSSAISRPVPPRQNTFYNSFPNTPTGSIFIIGNYDPRLVDSYSDMEDENDIEIGELPTHSNCEVPQFCHSSVVHALQYMRRLTLRILVAVSNFMTAPLWSSFFSLVVAFIEPVKHALEHHLQPLNGAINTAGKCAVPLTLVVLGAYFHDPPEDGEYTKASNISNVIRPVQTRLTMWQHLSNLHVPQSSTCQKLEERSRPGETKAVVLAVLARMVITPILVAPLLILAAKFDWHAVFEE